MGRPSWRSRPAATACSRRAGPSTESARRSSRCAPARRASSRSRQPERVLETPDWIAADLHVHSAQSFDSSFPLEHQLRAYAANGAEVLVSSEHDRVFDPRPELRRLSLEERLIPIVGVEITTAFTGGDSPYTIGHLNAYPVKREPLAWRGGAPAAEGRRLRSVLADVGRMPGAPFVQLNHPRSHEPHEIEDGAYFTHLAVAGEPYDPTRPLDAEPNRVLMERRSRHGPPRPRLRRRRAAERAEPSALSAGARGLVLVAAPGHLQGRGREQRFASRGRAAGAAAQLRRRRSCQALRGDGFSRGAACRPRLRHDRSVARGRGSARRDSASVSAAGEERSRSAWLRRRGCPSTRCACIATPCSSRTGRSRAGESVELPLAFERDAFVVVEVEGAPDATWSALAPGFTPFAFTNPIFVDADGDGAWTAPGLPEDPPPALADPLRSDLREETP